MATHRQAGRHAHSPSHAGQKAGVVDAESTGQCIVQGGSGGGGYGGGGFGGGNRGYNNNQQGRGSQGGRGATGSGRGSR